MDITRYRGDTSADRIQVINDSTGAVVNLTGSTLYLTVSTLSNPPDNTTQVYQLTGTLVDAVNGIVEFSPSAPQANLVGYYYFDIQLVDASAKIRTINKGTYIYKQDITKN